MNVYNVILDLDWNKDGVMLALIPLQDFTDALYIKILLKERFVIVKLL